MSLEKYKASCVSEQSEQSKIMAWAATMVDLGWGELAELFHVPNEGQRSQRTGAMLKRVGLKKGVSDLFLLVPKRGYHGAVIELKKSGGTTSEEQDWWIERFRERGYFARVCWCYPVAAAWLEWYVGAREDEPASEEGKSK